MNYLNIEDPIEHIQVIRDKMISYQNLLIRWGLRGIVITIVLRISLDIIFNPYWFTSLYWTSGGVIILLLVVAGAVIPYSARLRFKQQIAEANFVLNLPE